MSELQGPRLSEEKANMDKMRETYCCMIRQLLAWKDQGNTKAVNSFLKKRPALRRREIIQDCKAQWDAGNRGQAGLWL